MRSGGVDRVVHRAVPVVGRHHLVAGTQAECAQHGRDAERGVGYQRAAVRIGADERGEMPARVGHPVV